MVGDEAPRVPLTWPMIVFGLLLPITLAAALVIALMLMLPLQEFEAMVGFMLMYFFPPFGKESVIPLAIASGLNWMLVAFCIATIDVLLGLFMVWNFDRSKRIPLLGRWIVRFQGTGHRLLEKRAWMRELAFLGIVLFVIVPFEGSGGLAASILGRAIGMNRYKVLGAVTIGAYAGCFLIAAFSSTFLSLFTITVSTLITIFVGLVILYAGYHIWKRMRRAPSA